MSLLTNLQSLITSIGTTVKNVRTSISGVGTDDAAAVGTKLNTTATNLVDAINEVRTSAGAAITSVNGDTGPAVTFDSDGVAEGTTNLYFTDARSIASPITGFVSGAGALAATDTLLQAIQKLDGNVNAIDLTAIINDAASGAATTYSSDKITADIQAAVDALVNAAPGALDTLAELSASLGDDANFATSMTTALALKANIADTYSVTQLGANLDNHDFVADWNAAIA